MDYSPILSITRLSSKKLFSSFYHIYIICSVILIISFTLLYSDLFRNQGISSDFEKQSIYSHLLSYEQSLYDLLSYNYKVKQNIIRALTSKENVSETIPPLQIFRQHFMTAPDVQLTLCPISKAMSTVAMNIFCYLYNPVNFMKHEQSISSTIWSGRLCRKINELKSYDELQKSIGNKFYRTIAVVRDPLSRFISGYLDKCVRPKRKCFGCDSEDVFCVLTRLKLALINKPEIPSTTNITFSVELLHMAPQTWYCEMRKVFESLIFVKYGQTGYEHERMIKELAIAFTIARVPSTQVNYIENELKKSIRTNHTTTGMDIRKDLTREFSQRNDLRNLFWSIFKNDYIIFEYEF